MSKKKSDKKMAFVKDTLRRLGGDQLSVVAGGTNTRCPPGDTCFVKAG
jgi:hypothetical protein